MLITRIILLHLIIVTFLLISCGGGRTTLSKDNTENQKVYRHEIVSSELESLPKGVAKQFLATNYIYTYEDGTKLNAGYTNCKIHENNIELLTREGKPVLGDYSKLSFNIDYNTGYLLITDFKDMPAGYCVIKLRESDSRVKTGSALHSLGIKSVGGNRIQK